MGNKSSGGMKCTGNPRLIITDKGLAKHVGEEIYASVKYGLGENARYRSVNGELIENLEINYDGQECFAVDLGDARRKINLRPNNTVVGIYKRDRGLLTETNIFYDYVEH